jgi:DNA-binding transcriptional LysR family regulator
VNLRFVEAFYWAVTLKSVTRAAEKLFVTQSALSSRIAALEEELGVLLLDRRDKQFRLTIAGQRFHRHAERLLNLQREIRAELGSGVERGASLRLGVIESVLHSWLIEWLQRLRREHPLLQLELTVETTPVLMDQLRRGAMDVILAAMPTDGGGIASRPLSTMPMVFVGRRAPQAPRTRRIGLQELAQDHELLTFQRGSQPHAALIELFRRHGVEAPRVHSISSISAMVALVEQGFGVATLPQAAVQRIAANRPLAVLHCEVEPLPLPIHLSWRDDPSTPIVGLAAESVLGFTAAASDAAEGGRPGSRSRTRTVRASPVPPQDDALQPPSGAQGKPARSSKKSMKA